MESWLHQRATYIRAEAATWCISHSTHSQGLVYCPASSSSSRKIIKMAGISTRSVARLLTSISTTPTLRRSAASARTIASFKGLQTLAEPGRIPSEAMEESPFMSWHLEALSTWHEEAEKMRESRLVPTREDNIQVNVSEQVVELLEELENDGVLDARTGWLGHMHA